MRKKSILFLILLLAACNENSPQGDTEQSSQSGGMIEHLADAAVAGAAAGAAGAATHAMTQHAISKWSSRKRARRIQTIRGARR